MKTTRITGFMDSWRVRAACLCVSLMTGVLPVEAQAEQSGYLSDDKQQKDEATMPLWVGLGVWLGGVGPNIVLPPQNATAPNTGSVVDATPFEDGGGGIAGGGGAFLQLRFAQGRLGVRSGVFNERNRTWARESAGGRDDNTFILYYSVSRIPVLFEFIKLKADRRLSVGVGPEFLIGWNSYKVEIESKVLQMQNNAIRKDNNVAAALNLGWGKKFGDWVLGLDLKTAFNITAPRDYSDRVSSRPNGYGFLATHSLDVRFAISLMWEAGIGN